MNFVKSGRIGFGVAVLVGALTAGDVLQAQGLFTSNKNVFAPAKKPEPPIQPSGVATTASELVEGKNQNAMLQSNSAELLKNAIARYTAAISQGGWPSVSAAAVKKGDKGINIAALNKRLYLEGYLRVEGTQGQFADMYTTATDDAVRRFQRNHGLAMNGKLDAPTVAELNISADKRLATINANIARLDTYEQGLGDRYIVVNIPAQQLEAVSGGRVFERHNVIVGRPARPTPVVMTPLATVKFNPYWNAPVSIVEKDILPKLQSGTDYLKQINMKILKGGPTGPEVDPKTLDFKHLVPDDYLFREEPGPANAMATAKIEFSSPFGIYLHDTPEKPMFNFNNRFFSSGCIRVQNMPQLVSWVLNGQDGFNRDAIAGMAQSLQRLDVTLNAPPQLRVAYLTAWPTTAGTVAFRNDIYDLDASGFTVGQPMPVGEISPDGKRFVLKPLPRQMNIDAAEAEGSGFFGGRNATKANAATGKTSSLFAPSPTTAKGKKLKVNASIAATETAVADSTKPHGLFNWDAYYKKQAAEAKAGKKKGKLKAKADTKMKNAAAKVDAKLKAKTDVKVVAKPAKKMSKKKLDCKPGSDGKAPAGCKPADAAKAI